MRFGEDSMIATSYVSTSAPFSRASGIWVILVRQLTLLLSRMNALFPLANSQLFHMKQEDMHDRVPASSLDVREHPPSGGAKNRKAA